jgi:cyclopropane fatty-acyl-phospholipid synthase-like methyltransferase
MLRATDWDRYYDKPLATAKLTRRYSGHWLRTAIEKYAPQRTQISVIEFGGGNSCFFRTLVESLPISRYEVADLNEKSLGLFEQQARQAPSVSTAAHRVNLLTDSPSLALADVVFSVGLVEHFTPEGTRDVARRHFECVKDGGIVIITAPTPTWLYRMTRSAAERLGIWQFPDERPLLSQEILRAGEGLGTPLRSSTLWPLVLTQQAVIWRADKG